jgi:hypothetical protein
MTVLLPARAIDPDEQNFLSTIARLQSVRTVYINEKKIRKG